ERRPAPRHLGEDGRHEHARRAVALDDGHEAVAERGRALHLAHGLASACWISAIACWMAAAQAAEILPLPAVFVAFVTTAFRFAFAFLIAFVRFALVEAVSAFWTSVRALATFRFMRSRSFGSIVSGRQMSGGTSDARRHRAPVAPVSRVLLH